MAFQYCSIDKAGEHGNVYIITMNKPPENRLNIAACQELIRAYRTVVSPASHHMPPISTNPETIL